MRPEQLNEALAGVLSANEARDLGDAELLRCLGGCVSAHKLIPLAQSLRDSGRLVMRDGQPEIDSNR